MDWTTVGLCVGAFYIGLFAGIILQRMLRNMSSAVGVIHIIRNPDKTLFSLELEDDPEMIAYMDEVIFKVKTTEEAGRE